MKKVLFLISIFCLINFSVNAADWYLSPTGNNTTGDGSIGNPWFSPVKAKKSTGAISAGDTVIFLNGTYSYGSATCRLGYSADDSGSEGNIITYRAETNGSVTLNFDGEVGWDLDNVNGSSYITLIGFNCVNTILGVRLRDINQIAQYINVTATNTWPVSGEPIATGSYGGISTDVGSLFTIDHCIIDTYSTSTDAHGIYVAGGSGAIKDSEFLNNIGNGIQIQSGNAEHIIGTVYVYRNKIHDNTTRNGIYVASYGGGEITSVYIYNNLIWNNSSLYSPGSGITIGNTSVFSSAYVYNNTLYNNTYTGLNISGVTTGEARNNISVDNGTDISASLQAWAGTKSNNLTSSGNEPNAGVVGSLPNTDFQSLDDTSADFLKIDSSNNAIETGYDLSGTFTDDYFENTRTVPWDIGAHEYSFTDLIAPVYVSSEIMASGTFFRALYSDSSSPLQFGAGGSGGGALANCSGGATTLGTPSIAGLYVTWPITNRTVISSETGCQFTYTQPTDGLQDSAATPNDVVTHGPESVYNYSGEGNGGGAASVGFTETGSVTMDQVGTLSIGIGS